MKQKILLFAFTLLSTMLFSQAQQKAFLDWSTSTGTQNFFYKNVVKTDGSDVYIAGATMNGSGNLDILVAKYNSSGTQVWIQQYAGTGNGIDFASDMVISGNFVYITGAVTNSTVSPQTDVITMKFNKFNGVVSFVRTYAGSPGLIDGGKSITLDNASSSVLVTGLTTNSSGNSDILTLRYNASGTLQWVRVYAYGANKDDAGLSIRMHTSTNVNVNGVIQISNNVYKQISLSYAVSNGSLSSTNISSAVTTNSFDAVTDFAIDNSNNIYLSGTLTSTVSGTNFYVQKLNGSSLASIWTYTFDANGLNDVPSGIELDASNNVYVTGYTTNATTGRNMTLIKLNSSGVFQWNQTSTFNGNDEAVDLVIDSNNDIYITGSLTDDLNGLDFYTAKYNSSGTKIWDIQTDGIHTNDKATNMALDSLNNVIVTGQTEISPGNYVYGTAKYIQKDVITPTDFNGELPSNNFMYYANKGQLIGTNDTLVPDIKFYTHNTYPSFFIKNNSSSFVFARIDTIATTNDTLHRIDLTYDKSRSASKAYPLEQQREGYLNYYLAHTDSNGVTGVFGNKRLVTPDIYPNIDLMYSSNQNGIKYYYIIKPGGNLANIEMTFTGATSFSLNGINNALTINSSIGSLTFDRPTAYQLTTGNATVAVTGWTPDWQTNGASNKYKFNTGSYTSSLTLVIQVDQGNLATPSSTTVPNIEWSTNFGGLNYEGINDIKVGTTNNLYISGFNSTTPLPQVPGPVYQISNNGLTDGFLSKFDQNGKLIWTTYVGGTSHDNIRSFDISNNGLGDLFCIGTTKSTNIVCKTKTTTSINYNNHASSGADNDGFIFQLNQNGLNNNWLTYYGGVGVDNFTRCKFDNSGNLFIIGASESSNLIVVGSAPQYTNTYNDINGAFDAYIIKLDNNSYNPSWATYVNSSSSVSGCSSDGFAAIDIDSKNNIFVGGSTTGSNFPIFYSSGSTTISPVANCFGDGVIMKFNNLGLPLWSTCIGGDGFDGVQAIKLDGKEVYVGGISSGITTFPTIFSGSFYANTTKTITPISSFQNGGFFLHFDSLNYLKHSTLIGGDDGEDGINDIVIDNEHNIYLIGSTSSSILDLPSNGNPANTWSQGNNGNSDSFIFTVKKGTTDVIWSTQLGGNHRDEVSKAIIDGSNRLFLVGSMGSAFNFPWNNGGGSPTHFQGTLTGGESDYDGFITRFKLSNVNYVGLNEIKHLSNDLLLYPNPAQESVTVYLSNSDEKKNFTVFNSIGQIVSSGIISYRSATINISLFSQGIYFIEISDKTNKRIAKFIKQ